MQDIYQTFEFHKILEQITEFSKSELSKENILLLRMSSDRSEVEYNNKLLQEGIDLISRFGNIPISNSANVLTMIEIAKKSGLFTVRDLSLIREDILTSMNVTRYFAKVDNQFDLVSKIIADFKDLSSLEKEIKRVITPSLTIDDKATPKLKEIRDKLRSLESSLNSKITNVSYKYSSYLSEEVVTIRDGHYVLPVKTAYKSKVLGIVYDVSGTGNTTFIEPLEIVQLNNDIQSLKVEENTEIRRILKMLTSLVLLQEEEVSTNNKIIGNLDFIQSKALYALANNMHVGRLSSKQEIHLIGARHPLIDSAKVVSNDYHITEEKPIVIISGPNAGGKTVSLKVVGLVTLMFLSGLPLPVSEADIAVFNHIYIDIGDNQSLSDNLSTFSAHMSQISEILDVVKGKDLILLDELGTGTDPKEGEALALATIKYLETKHPLCLISSHFNKVKEYALVNDRIENSSLLFNEDKLIPTYKYKYSLPGKSYGLEVASRYGIKESVVEEAKRILNSENEDTNKIINELVKKAGQVEELLKENEIMRKKLDKERKELEIDKENFQVKRSTLLSDVREEKAKLLEDLNNEITKIRKELLNPNLKAHEVTKLMEKANKLKDEVDEEHFNETINVNDYVSIPSMFIFGTVTRINGKKASINTNDGLTLEIALDRLHKEEIKVTKHTKVASSKASHYVDKINTDTKLELNIIGLRRDEAKEALIKYLDTCKIKNFKVVRIIHGFGNGILRKMVHEYFSTQKGIKFRLGDINEGGGGATVVTLHD